VPTWEQIEGKERNLRVFLSLKPFSILYNVLHIFRDEKAAVFIIDSFTCVQVAQILQELHSK
jgi:hypothetical protein